MLAQEAGAKFRDATRMARSVSVTVASDAASTVRTVGYRQGRRNVAETSKQPPQSLEPWNRRCRRKQGCFWHNERALPGRNAHRPELLSLRNLPHAQTSVERATFW